MKSKSKLNSRQKYTLLMPVGQTGRGADENESHSVIISRDIYEI
jgi:hypothetical protein